MHACTPAGHRRAALARHRLRTYGALAATEAQDHSLWGRWPCAGCIAGGVGGGEWRQNGVGTACRRWSVAQAMGTRVTVRVDARRTAPAGAAPGSQGTGEVVSCRSSPRRGLSAAGSAPARCDVCRREALFMLKRCPLRRGSVGSTRWRSFVCQACQGLVEACRGPHSAIRVGLSRLSRRHEGEAACHSHWDLPCGPGAMRARRCRVSARRMSTHGVGLSGPSGSRPEATTEFKIRWWG